MRHRGRTRRQQAWRQPQQSRQEGTTSTAAPSQLDAATGTYQASTGPAGSQRVRTVPAATLQHADRRSRHHPQPLTPRRHTRETRPEPPAHPRPNGARKGPDLGQAGFASQQHTTSPCSQRPRCRVKGARGPREPCRRTTPQPVEERRHHQGPPAPPYTRGKERPAAASVARAGTGRPRRRRQGRRTGRGLEEKGIGGLSISRGVGASE